MDGLDVQRERLERAKAKSLFICTPIARHPVRQYTTSLAKTCVQLGRLGILCYIQHVVGQSNLPRARNELVAAFLASDYTDMVFIDDDMGWEPNDLVRLLASDQPLIAGVGAKKVFLPDTAPNKWCVRTLPDGACVQDEMGNIEVAGVGTGFMKINRSVFEAFKAAHPDRKRKGWPTMPEAARAHYYEFFRFGVLGDDEVGEDIGFCLEWRALGGKVFVDPTIKLVHVGEMEFGGDFTALLEER